MVILESNERHVMDSQMPIHQRIEQALNRFTTTKVDDYCSLPCCFCRQVPKNDNGYSRKPTMAAQGDNLSPHERR